MDEIRRSMKLFRYNMANLILFEGIFKAVSFAVLIPLYYAFVNMAVRLSGISYLTKETVKKFFKAPSTYAIIFMMLMFTSMYIMINVSAICYSYHSAYQLKKVDPIQMALYGIKSSIRILRPRNMPIFPFVLLYMPVITNVILNFELLNIRVPYITDLITINVPVTVICISVYALMVLFSLRYTFLLHIYNIEKVSFRKAIDRSKELMDGKRSKTIGNIGNWVILMVGLPALINYLYTGPLLDNVLSLDGTFKIVTMIYEAIKIVLSIIYILVGLPMIYAYICNMFYDLAPEHEGELSIDDYTAYDARISRRRERKVLAVVIAVTLILNIGFYTLKRYNIISLDAEYLDKVTITAHRGDCSNAPENTMAAFEMAIENGADVIELDVRETKDGEIVVMHDESLMRTCGVKKKVGKLTYEKLSQYSAGATYKGPNKELYKDEKIPTLREVIEEVGDRAELNIELKPAKTDKNLEQSVVDIIEEYDYYDNCVVTSLTYGSIRKVKEADPRIKTVYVMAVAMGDLYDLEYADAFSIKYRYISNDKIRQAHSMGKEIYAWTINDKQTLEKMMLLDVDSIITNKPAEMRREMYENYYGDTLIERLSNLIESQL